MRGKRAKQLRKMVYFMGKPKPSFVDENGTLQVDMLRAIYQRTKKHYKEHICGTDLARLISTSIDGVSSSTKEDDTAR